MPIDRESFQDSSKILCRSPPPSPAYFGTLRKYLEGFWGINIVLWDLSRTSESSAYLPDPFQKSVKILGHVVRIIQPPSRILQCYGCFNLKSWIKKCWMLQGSRDSDKILEDSCGFSWRIVYLTHQLLRVKLYHNFLFIALHLIILSFSITEWYSAASYSLKVWKFPWKISPIYQKWFKYERKAVLINLTNVHLIKESVNEKKPFAIVGYQFKLPSNTNIYKCRS